MKQNEEFYSRTRMLLGDDGICRLKKAKVIIFGIGGVGGHAAEAIARAGVGKIALIDADRVSVSNLNRQTVALLSTVGTYKTEVMKNRILDINKDAEVLERREFYSPDNACDFCLTEYDFILDCIDSTRSKLHLISCAKEAGVPIISSMGTGNKLDPTRLKIADISKTHTDPLAKLIRVELRKRGINHLPVVFSDEEPITTESRTPSSVPFVPATAGLIMAGYVIRKLSGIE